MRCKNRLYLSVAAIAGVLAAAPAGLRAQTAVAIDNDDIGGTVTGASGPEAGVWVIAETTDLPTRYAKMVVTDDQGRYVVPDLPKAKYKVWVRGYGLIDSPKVDGEPGKQLDLKAVAAPNEAAAAQYYPAIYWYAMLKIPEASQFGGKSDIPTDHPGRVAQRDQEPGPASAAILASCPPARSRRRSASSSRARTPGAAAPCRAGPRR
jgi:hypothetical protein